jgi:hypothetical protein
VSEPICVTIDPVEVVIKPVAIAAEVTGGVGPQGPQGPAGPSGLSSLALTGGIVSPLVLEITQQVAA